MGRNADKEYLRELRQLMIENGISEILTTTDNPEKGTIGTIPELFLMTVNYKSDPVTSLDLLKHFQPDKPFLTMEFYPGWFDFWGRDHNTQPSDQFKENVEVILSYPSSVNIYMFHGGTNFGFLNGAQNLKVDDENSGFVPITTSYDYDAPLTEAGDYTEKYYVIKELISKYNDVATKMPDMPDISTKTAYANLIISQQIALEDILEKLELSYSYDLINMEKLEINENSGQSYGYIVYRKTHLNIEANSVLLIEGRVCDTIMVLVNGKLISPILEKATDLNSFGTWRTENSAISLSTETLQNATLDLIVENWGRVNIAVYKQKKGLYQGSAMINDIKITNWTIFPIEFKKQWTNSLNNWNVVNFDSEGPSLFKTALQITDNPLDTFIYMENWTKGIVIVNGFVLGRYSKMGPIQTLYLPAPLLRKGVNDIVIFEHFRPGIEIIFSEYSIYKRN